MEEKRQDHHIDVICGCVVMGTESEIGTGGPEISAARFSDDCHFLWGEGRQTALARARNNETKMLHR